MSDYVPNPNTGTLWPNKKTSEKHPDVRGDIFIDRDFIEKLLRSSKEDLIKVQVAGWTKMGAGKKYLSLRLSEPYVKEEPRQSSIDESDVPF